jgi:predicted nucleotidyltransferase
MDDLYLMSARREATARLLGIKGDLLEADAQFGERACVYATGSFGRLEAGPKSDLDLFIVVDTSVDAKKIETPLLTAVDEIRLKHSLIIAAENNVSAKFDGGGRFLTSHTLGSYTRWLGSDEDDYRNTLTGRMLMLLESKPLIGESVYNKTIDRVIDAYFRDYTGHENDFVPSFLFNDVSRLWRTFCVNYEFHRKEGDSRNKIKNLKLKFSRMLTCFSGILFLAAVFARKGCVTPTNVKEMAAISPTERLETLGSTAFPADDGRAASINDIAQNALKAYSDFLELTHLESRKAVRLYNGNEADWRAKSYMFGSHLTEIIDLMAESSPAAARLRRLIMI